MPLAESVCGVALLLQVLRQEAGVEGDSLRGVFTKAPLQTYSEGVNSCEEGGP